MGDIGSPLHHNPIHPSLSLSLSLSCVHTRTHPTEDYKTSIKTGQLHYIMALGKWSGIHTLPPSLPPHLSTGPLLYGGKQDWDNRPEFEVAPPLPNSLPCQ